jgi:DHA3 family macrolide efflux protein-like MFS transporter
MHAEKSVTHNWKVPFFTIWTGQAFSLLGSKIVQFALVWWLTEETGSATVLATSTLVALVPEILLGPFAGAYVDRWNRRTVMIVADGLIALASLWLASMFWLDAIQIWHVYVMMALRAIGGSFHWPAMQASTSLMVPKEQLTRVAGVNQTLYGILNIVGPPLGALLLELLPFHSTMMVDVGTATLAILPLFFVQIPQPKRAPDANVQSIWSDMLDGLRYLREWKGALILIGMALLFKLALTPAFSLVSLLVSDHFGGGAAQYGLVESVSGVGIVAGGLILSAWGGFDRKILTNLMGLIGIGVSMAVVGFTPAGAFWLAVGAFFFVGFLIPMVDGPIMAIMQSAVKPEYQGRVFTLIGSLLSLSSPIGLALAGPLSDVFGLQIWFVTAGVLTSAVGVAGLLVPAVMQIEENANGGAETTEEQTLAEVETLAPVA